MSEKHMMNLYSMEIILHEEALAAAVAAKAWRNDLNHYNSVVVVLVGGC